MKEGIENLWRYFKSSSNKYSVGDFIITLLMRSSEKDFLYKSMQTFCREDLNELLPKKFIVKEEIK